MALVLTENEDTESGIRYADFTGVSYQFPKRYRRLIRSGERFVYYRGRKKRGGGRLPQAYFGIGIIGDVNPDPRTEGRLVCDILDYLPFERPLFFKDESGNYREAGAERRGYFQTGVRKISEDDFREILSAASLGSDGLEPSDLSAMAAGFYASPEHLRDIERFAVNRALELLKREFPRAAIAEQARNNPGFDILVRDGTRNIYVEVKGTARSAPRFLMSHGEVRFSVEHSDDFALIVVHAVDLVSGDRKIFRHSGAIDERRFSIAPVQWNCLPL